MPVSSLQHLPDELISSILYQLPSRSAISLGLTCRRIQTLSEQPLLWKHYCRAEFQYWKHRDDTDRGLLAGAPNAPWKQHFVQRVQRDAHNHDIFESLLASQYERYHKIREIAQSEYEVVGMLQGYCNASAEFEDVLARRYFAEVVLSLIHRTNALRIWSSLANDEDPDLEEQLAAFDLFVIGKESGTVGHIKGAIDDLAEEIKQEHPDILELDVEQRAILVVRQLREKKIVGIEEGREYRDMRNNYMYSTLIRKSHGALPLQSAVMFCSVARRLGIDAHPCNYPAHIFVMVRLPTAPTISENADPNEALLHNIYLDPFAQDTPIPLETLTYRLRIFGFPPSEHVRYLSPASVASLVMRTANNIRHSYEDQRRDQRETDIENQHALYSFLWCSLLVEERMSDDPRISILHRPALAHLPPFFRDHYQEDLDLVNKYLGPPYATHPHRQVFQRTMAEIKAADLNRKPVVRRAENTKLVRHKIGQVFQHRRYGYIGAVRAWDKCCQADERWCTQMRVDDLQRGREQSFYHVIVEDRTERYVAEDNIEPIYTEPPEKLMRLAGKYFKRWDPDSRMFISNVKDEFPDD